jgi:type IV fimbrial biogenesis protein FimT
MIRRLSPQVVSLAKTRIGPRREDALSRYYDHGFTIVELIVIVAILVSLISLATFNLADWRNNARLKTAARNVVSTFHFTRVEAAKRNTTASIRFTKGGLGVGKCEVIIGGQTIRELPVPGSVVVTKLEQPVGTIVVAADATYQLSNRGFPVGSAGLVTLSNGERTYDIELKPAGGVALSGPY